MQPVAAAETCPVPAIESVAALAEWLGVDPNELDWFADLKGLVARRDTPEPLRHYRYRVLTKRSGNIRLIEAPKPRLKGLQRHILDRILNGVPAHPAVHGFVKGRSIKTFTAPHAGQRVVLRMDLRDFFPSIQGARIQSFFRTVGYPESVADLLGGICTNAVPAEAWNVPAFEVDPTNYGTCGFYTPGHTCRRARPLHPRWRTYAFTGPTTAWPAWRNRLARSIPVTPTTSRFPGGEEFDRHVAGFSTHPAAILHEEGFAVNHRKTRVMRQGVRQHLAGLVTNQRVNIVRADFDLLKAILTNCNPTGSGESKPGSSSALPAASSRTGGFRRIDQSGRGRQLRALFDRIHWE